jgi:hypothetical protein
MGKISISTEVAIAGNTTVNQSTSQPAIVGSTKSWIMPLVMAGAEITSFLH